MKKTTLLFSIIFLLFYFQTKAQHIISVRPTDPSTNELQSHSCPPGYTWKGNEWKWDKQTLTYNWEPGKCLRIKKGQIWLPGQWSRVAKGWIWTPGQWRKI